VPTTLTVVGLLESTSPTLVERDGYSVPPMPRWMGFASYEYIDSHERYENTPTHMLVVPIKGRESEMEAWLEESIASPCVTVVTLGSSYGVWQVRNSGVPHTYTPVYHPLPRRPLAHISY
jgi:hypothetical protein